MNIRTKSDIERDELYPVDYLSEEHRKNIQLHALRIDRSNSAKSAFLLLDRREAMGVMEERIEVRIPGEVLYSTGFLDERDMRLLKREMESRKIECRWGVCQPS